MEIKYYDIGVNLFCRQFLDPEKIVLEAADAGVCCILTGTSMKENQKIHDFVKTRDVYGTAGIHPHNADRAGQEDFRLMERILSENEKVTKDMTEVYGVGAFLMAGTELYKMAE